MSILAVPQGEFDLARHPVRVNEQLRAWDAADEYLLRHLHDADALGGDPTPSVLIVNGGQGAVATALAAGPAGRTGRLASMSDSFVDHLATSANLRRNGIDPACVASIDPFDLDDHGDGLPTPTFDLVLVKLPKSSALLEDQLCRLAPHLAPGAVVVGAAMAKHLHSSTLALIERVLGPTSTSLAQKKARLVFVTPEPDAVAPVSPWPVVVDAGAGRPTMVNHANVFSRERLDVGTRFLLDHLPTTEGPCEVVDLGCGNGVVGVAVAAANPEATVTFVDESYMAVASAEATYRANLGDAGIDGRARFVVGDGIELPAAGDLIERGSIDLIVNNPPFHDDHAVGDAIAWQMFTESHRALVAGGELRVVGNRHLAYHAKLKRIFGNCKVVASNSKFVVYTAVRG